MPEARCSGRCATWWRRQAEAVLAAHIGGGGDPMLLPLGRRDDVDCGGSSYSLLQVGRRCCLRLPPAFSVTTEPGDYYMTVDQTDERLGPDGAEKSTDTLFKRQK